MAVIGAGIAGLVTAKVLREDGFEVVVFEKEPAIGGVWAPSRTYPGLRTNNPRETYAYSDFPYPATSDEFPTAVQVRAYLAAYADHFQLRAFIRLNTEVRSVGRGGQGNEHAFEVRVRTDGHDSVIGCDFVAVCNGVFSHPYVPAIDGREVFEGRVLHSSEIGSECDVTGKRVVVVGGGKSALDCAAWATRHAASCTLVCRAPHWMIPRYIAGHRADRVILTRLAELFIPYHSPSPIESLLHGPARPLVKAWWWLQTRLLRRWMRIPEGMTPEHSLPSGFESIGIGGEFYDLVRSGSVQVRRGRISGFTGAAAVALAGGEILDADIVIFATGWRQNISFFAAPLRDAIWRDGRFQLYRHILPLLEPRIGFIGYASSVACPLTSEIAAHWLSQCFRGELPLPPIWEMQAEVARVHAWAERLFPARREGYFIGPFIAHYIDQLMRDMGLRRFRTSSVVTEYFAPLWPSRYSGVARERSTTRHTQ